MSRFASLCDTFHAISPDERRAAATELRDELTRALAAVEAKQIRSPG